MNDALITLRRQLTRDLPTAGDDARAVFLSTAAELGDVATVSEILEWPLSKSWIEQALAGADWMTHAEGLVATLPVLLAALKERNLAHAGFREALTQAVRAGIEPAIELLLDHAGMIAQGPKPTPTEQSALDEALAEVAKQGRLALAKQLMERRANPTANGYHALYAAARAGHADLLQALLDRTSYWIMPTSQHEVLMEAVRCGHLACVKCLWSEQASKSEQSDALYAAAQHGHLVLVEALSSMVRGGHLRALNGAAERGHTDVVRFLITQTDPRKEQSYPLGKAIRYGHWEAFQVLLPVSQSNLTAHLVDAVQSDFASSTAMIHALIPRAEVIEAGQRLKDPARLDRLGSLCPQELRLQLIEAFPGVDLAQTRAQLRQEHLAGQAVGPTRPRRRV